MRIVQTVFGAFHHFDLARELHARGHLDTIFSSWPWARLARERIPRSKVRTFPWIHTPEYLLRRQGLLPRWLEDATSYANALAFDEYTLRNLPQCDALVAISGSSLKTGRLLQQRGGIFICDRGSSHHRYQEHILSEEYRLWKVNRPVSDPRDTLREEAIYEQANALVVPSTFAARSFTSMGVPLAKLHTIPLGVNLSSFHPVSQPPADRLEVLFVGSLSLRKGIPYLLQAFAALTHTRKRLRLVGGISREMPEVLRRLPMQDVEILGPIPQDQLSAIMSASHVTVLPSIEDGFGLVIGQALASGCPVIASDHTGAPDMIADGTEGFLVPIRDAPAITSRLEQIASDPALRQQMSEAALARVASLGGWSTYGDTWERLLQRLTGTR